MEVAPLKNLFFLAVLELDEKDSFGYNKQLKGWERPSLQYKLTYKHCLACFLFIYTLPSMNFKVNLKMKKPTLCCCFTCMVFIELNFTVAFLLIWKTRDDWLAGKVGRWGILRNGILMKDLPYNINLNINIA